MNYKNLLNIYFFLAFLFTAQPCDTFNMTDAAKPLSILFMFGASLFMCLHFKINTWREDKFERSVANGTETVFVTLRFCVVRKQLKATLKPNAAGVQLPPHYYRNG